MAPRLSKGLIADKGGAAAAEMAMVMPLLLVLMFGSFEVARYFHNEHVVLKSVRDGARYAARQGFANYTCPSTVNATVEANTRNIVRFGKVTPAVGDQPRLGYWNATISGGAQSVTVNLTCPSKTVGTETLSGLYATAGPATGVPVVTVNAIVEFRPMFGALTMGDRIVRLTAESQATVMGI